VLSVRQELCNQKVKLTTFVTCISYFGFLLSALFYQYSVLIFIHMLPLPEGRRGEAWKPSKKQRFFLNRRQFCRKVISLCYYFEKYAFFYGEFSRYGDSQYYNVRPKILVLCWFLYKHQSTRRHIREDRHINLLRPVNFDLTQ